MVRVKSKWNQPGTPRTLLQMANAISATIWKLAANVVLNLENENFQTDTQAQRIDVIEELTCYLVHACDRLVYGRASDAERAEFITSLARDLSRLLEDSRVDVEGQGEYRTAFVELLNRRCADYAGYEFSVEEGAGFALRCRLGDRVAAAMGERDRRWIPDFIVAREAPEIEAALKRSLFGLVSFEAAEQPR